VEFDEDQDPVHRAVLEIYNMGTLENSFGVFKTEAGNKIYRLPGGSEGRLEYGLLQFYKGKFYHSQDFRAYWNHYIPQPSVFFLREVMEEVGLLNESLDYVMDYDFWVRCSQKYFLYYINEIMAYFRIHEVSSSITISPSGLS